MLDRRRKREEKYLKPKPVAASYAALFSAILSVVFALSFPAVSQAKSKEMSGFEKSDLVTTGDFIECSHERS